MSAVDKGNIFKLCKGKKIVHNKIKKKKLITLTIYSFLKQQLLIVVLFFLNTIMIPLSIVKKPIFRYLHIILLKAEVV